MAWLLSADAVFPPFGEPIVAIVLQTQRLGVKYVVMAGESIDSR
jgi:hypothetical protein